MRRVWKRLSEPNTLTDKNGDGVNDMIKWKETLSPGENKSIILNGKVMDLFSGLGAIGGLDLGNISVGLGDSGGLAFLLLLAAILVPLTVMVLAIRYVRHERRRRMLVYLTAIERTLKGENVPSTDQKK